MNRQARVGLVVVLCLGLFALALLIVGSRTLLFSDRFVLRAQFNQVAGLSAGADVQFQGVSVGAVSSVALPGAPGSLIEVTMGIRNRARHVVHSGTQAQIKTEGLLGSMIVVLVNPPITGPMPEPIESGDLIRGVDPFDLFEITDKALASVQRFEQSAMSFERIMDDIRAGEGTLGKLVYDPELYNSMVATANETERLMAHLANDAEALVALATQATEGVGSILGKLDEGDGTLAKMLNDPEIYATVLSAADTLQSVVTSLQTLTVRVGQLTDWGTLGAFRFSELMEAGKHNWLFKRYFEERGYMEQAPFEVRERAIAESYRALQQKELDLLAWEARLAQQAAHVDSILQALDR